MTEATHAAWHAQGLLDINTTLDVSPVGWQERDEIGLSDEEKQEHWRKLMRLGAKHNGFEPITHENVGGPTWSFRRLQPPKLRDPPAAMSLGGKPVVSPQCRDVLEQADLGEVDVFQIEVLDIRRKEVTWPERYVLHIRNAKYSIDIDKEVAAGNVVNGGTKVDLFHIFADRSVSLGKAAQDGRDLWLEGGLANIHRTNMFMSQRLHDLLENADMLKPWGVNRASIDPSRVQAIAQEIPADGNAWNRHRSVFQRPSKCLSTKLGMNAITAGQADPRAA